MLLEQLQNACRIYKLKELETEQEAAELRILMLKSQSNELILKDYPIYKQLNASLGVLTEQEILDCKNHISSIREKCNLAEIDIQSILTSDLTKEEKIDLILQVDLEDY